MPKYLKQCFWNLLDTNDNQSCLDFLEAYFSTGDKFQWGKTNNDGGYNGGGNYYFPISFKSVFSGVASASLENLSYTDYYRGGLNIAYLKNTWMAVDSRNRDDYNKYFVIVVGII